jgi:hypothetical protein
MAGPGEGKNPMPPLSVEAVRAYIGESMDATARPPW